MEILEDGDFRGQVFFELLVQLSQIDRLDGYNALAARRALWMMISRGRSKRREATHDMKSFVDSSKAAPANLFLSLEATNLLRILGPPRSEGLGGCGSHDGSPTSA
jgi:hypothetical protein